MSLKKPKRLVSDENKQAVSEQLCVVCGLWPVDVHHIRTRGSGGGDELSNLMALCRRHHVEIHQTGRETFMRKYKLLT